MSTPSSPQPRARRTLRTGIPLAVFGIALAFWAAGCGGGQGGGPASGGGDSKSSGLASGPMAADDGPVKHEQAEEGAKLFPAKGCSACHAFGRRITGPDLAGVTKRRTRAWMLQQIQHPDVMTKQDPTARELLATYAVQMPNLKLTEAEAQALVEYFKSQDHPAAAEAEKEK